MTSIYLFHANETRFGAYEFKHAHSDLVQVQNRATNTKSRDILRHLVYFTRTLQAIFHLLLFTIL